ncbi:WD40 repeat-like protein [Lepidopterella palustris CBS 459.81]|uniref:DNA damage-binding protein CMR1 n=1 Tax=Lepidopterella palustris CBS 459.81 TaxID=1314670 RepID=A0A8E2EJQ8_9PEZI|nr:WD40 repeat-like protein [Lepidopterella palustris CBS 459.81]
MGNLGICDCSQSSSSGVKNEDEDEENDVREGPAITTFKLHSRTIHTFQFSPVDYNALYSASYDSSIRKLDLAKGVAVEVYAPPESSEAPLSGVEVTSHNPHMLYFSTLEGQFGIYDMRTPAQKAAGLEIFQLSEKKIGGFTLHPEKPHFLATASLDRTLKIWDLRKISGKGEDRLPTLVGEHESKLSVSHAAWNGEGMVATASYDDTIKIHDFSACGKWKAGTTLSSEEMDPVRVIPHNNQTGRWVTM